MNALSCHTIFCYMKKIGLRLERCLVCSEDLRFEHREVLAGVSEVNGNFAR